MTILTELEFASARLAYSASVANDENCNIYNGRNNTDIELPSVTVTANAASEIVLGSRFYRTDLTIQVEERAIDSDVTSSLAKTVFNSFLTNTATSQLTEMSSGSLLVGQIDVKDIQTIFSPDKTWIQEMNLEVLCAQHQPN